VLLKKIVFVFFIFLITATAQDKILIYMDLEQTDHLKAYGITFHALTEGLIADWLLNYPAVHSL